MEMLYIVRKKQDLELTMAQILSSILQNSDLKKVGKITRPFMYDLNQIPYDNTAEVINRFKWLDLVDRVLEVLWLEVHNIVQDIETKTTFKKKKCKKVKGCLRRL